MTQKNEPTCVACDAQELIGTASHEADCHCYAMAFLMGIVQAVGMLQSGQSCFLCLDCRAQMKELAEEAGVSQIDLVTRKAAVDVH